MCDDLGGGRTRVGRDAGDEGVAVGRGIQGWIEVKFVKFGIFVLYSRVCVFFSLFSKYLFAVAGFPPGFGVSGIGGYHQKDH